MSGPRIVGLEEHLVTPDVLAAWERLAPRLQDLSLPASRDGRSGAMLAATGPERLAAMDEAGVDVQVLSLSTPGVQDLEPAESVALQTATNDHIAALVRENPERFGGFATLALGAPEGAAAELGRAVGDLGLDGAMLFPRTRGRSLDRPEFLPVFEAADALRAPLYLHPQSPPAAVRAAYHEGFGPDVDAAFATHGLGWHVDTGVELVRLMLAGVFDRFPELRIVVGHWGETVLFFLDRIDGLAQVAHLPRRPSEYLRDQVFVTPSGMLSQRYLRWAVEVLGAGRVMVAADHPFVPLAPGAVARFVADAPMSDPDRAAFASGTWERLRARIRR